MGLSDPSFPSGALHQLKKSWLFLEIQQLHPLLLEWQVLLPKHCLLVGGGGDVLLSPSQRSQERLDPDSNPAALEPPPCSPPGLLPGFCSCITRWGIQAVTAVAFAGLYFCQPDSIQWIKNLLRPPQPLPPTGQILFCSA